MVLVWLHNNTELINKNIDGHITIQVIEGAVECTIETGTVQLKKQQIISIHPGIVHSSFNNLDSNMTINVIIN